MFRVSVFFSLCLHIIVLWVAGIVLPEDRPPEKLIEKRFEVNLRKTSAVRSQPTQQSSHTTPLKTTERQLPASRELLPQPVMFQKKPMVSTTTVRPFSPKNVIRETQTPRQPLTKVLPTTQEFTVAKLNTPKPIPTTVPTRIPTPVKMVKPTIAPSPTTIPEPTPTTAPTPSLSPTPVVQALSAAPSEPMPSREPEVPVTSVTPVTPVNMIESDNAGNEDNPNAVLPEQGTAAASTEQRQEELLGHYLHGITDKIQAVKSYPRQARRKGWEGTLVIELRILASGEVEKTTVIKKSQYNVLDKAALKAIEQAQPFPRFPDELTFQFIMVTVPIEFLLSR